ncbi:MAG: DHH family phosphoesterase, partial [Mesorhizobium sp.]
MSSSNRLFLGVRKSATGLSWEHRLSERQEAIALAMAQNYGVSDIVARILAGRDVGQDQAARFLDPTIRDLMPDPLTMTDMGSAAERIAIAVKRRERVAIFGDYDVDGACSSALMKRLLDHFDVPNEIYIPDRIFEGYGPNPDAMRELVGRGARLIVTVDCGTNSAASIAAAREAGADVVVLD